MMKKRLKSKFLKVHPIISESEIKFHYELLKGKKAISIDLIHPALKVDLDAFLCKKGVELNVEFIPFKLYKDWIKKLDNSGLDYAIRINKTNLSEKLK
jgi:hypothetical protein